MDLVNHLQQFLDNRADQTQPILLGVSGGADSMALLHAAVQCHKRKNTFFAVAHVDHGWRQESAAEADQLGVIVQSLGVAFHLRRLEQPPAGSNPEAWCREQRLAFFEELCREHHYQAVMLAHHADDQAETVLKRIFEGASLTALASMQPVAPWQSIKLWRPFLALPKQSLVDWLAERHITFFDDWTNRDERYLRSRLRLTLLPTLASQFGKEIAGPLAQLAEEARLLDHFCSTTLQPILAQACRGPWGIALDCGAALCDDLFTLRYIVRAMLHQCDAVFSHEQITKAAEVLRSGKAAITFANKTTTLEIDRGKAFVITRYPISGEELPLLALPAHWGSWQINCCNNDTVQTNWRALWQGTLTVALPPGQWRLIMPQNNLRLYALGVKVGDYWSQHKVPAFMRRWLPLLQNDDGQVVQLLCTQKLPITESCHFYKISFDETA